MPGFFHLVFVEVTNVLDCLLQSLLQFLGALGSRLCNGGSRHANVLALETVELLGVFSSLRNATLLDVGKNAQHLERFLDHAQGSGRQGYRSGQGIRKGRR